MLVVGGWAVVRAYRFQRTEARQAAALGFGLHIPREGSGFDVTRAELFEGSSLRLTVERRGGLLHAGEHALGAADLTPPECDMATTFATRGGSFADALEPVEPRAIDYEP